MAENLRETLPLFSLAVVGIALGIVLYGQTAGGHASRLPIWMLSMAIGVAALGGGMAGLLVGDFRPAGAWRHPIPPGGYVIVPVDEWERERAVDEPEDARPWSEERVPAQSAVVESVPAANPGRRPAGPSAPAVPPPSPTTPGELVPTHDWAGNPPPAAGRSAAPPPALAGPPGPAPGSTPPESRPVASSAEVRPLVSGVPATATAGDDLGALLAELEREAMERLQSTVPEPKPSPPKTVVCVTCLGRIDPSGEQTKCKSCGLPLCPRCYHLGEKVSPAANLCRFCRTR